MKELVELARFKEKVTRGRFTGQETEYALLVGGDNYSWNISRKNLNSTTPPKGEKYCKGFCNLLDYLEGFNIPADEAIDKIIDALSKNTGINSNDLCDKVVEAETLKEKGELIDSHFRCNYNKPEHDSGKQTDKDRIYIRVLKAKVGQKD